MTLQIWPYLGTSRCWGHSVLQTPALVVIAGDVNVIIMMEVVLVVVTIYVFVVVVVDGDDDDDNPSFLLSLS